MLSVCKTIVTRNTSKQSNNNNKQIQSIQSYIQRYIHFQCQHNNTKFQSSLSNSNRTKHNLHNNFTRSFASDTNPSNTNPTNPNNKNVPGNKTRSVEEVDLDFDFGDIDDGNLDLDADQTITTKASMGKANNTSIDNNSNGSIDRWASILDPNNPPKLSYDHYRMLKRINTDDTNLNKLNDNNNKTNEDALAMEAKRNWARSLGYLTADDLLDLRCELSNMDVLDALDALTAAGVELTQAQCETYEVAFNMRYPNWQTAVSQDEKNNIIFEAETARITQQEKKYDDMQTKIELAKKNNTEPDLTEFTKRISKTENPHQITDEQLINGYFNLPQSSWNKPIPRAGDEIIANDIEYPVNPSMQSLINTQFQPEDQLIIDDSLQFPKPRAIGTMGTKKSCRFCRVDPTGSNNNLLKYTNVELLKQFINARGMITSRKVNNNCSRHQREISMNIKRARTIGLLGYQTNWTVPPEFVYGIEAVKQARTIKTTELIDNIKSFDQTNTNQLNNLNIEAANLFDQDGNLIQRKLRTSNNLDEIELNADDLLTEDINPETATDTTLLYQDEISEISKKKSK
jgi:small subunit ribosomal protein S18